MLQWKSEFILIYNYFIEIKVPLCNGKNCIAKVQRCFFNAFVSNFVIWHIQTELDECVRRWQLCVLFISYQSKNAQICVLGWQINCVFGTISFWLLLSILIVCVSVFLYHFISFCTAIYSVCRLCFAAMKRIFDV